MCSGDVASQDYSQNDPALYSLEKINTFLDNTFGRQVNVKDVEWFEKSVAVLSKKVGP